MNHLGSQHMSFIFLEGSKPSSVAFECLRKGSLSAMTEVSGLGYTRCSGVVQTAGWPPRSWNPMPESDLRIRVELDDAGPPDILLRAGPGVRHVRYPRTSNLLGQCTRAD